MDEDTMLEILEEYLLPAQIIPFAAWSTADLALFECAINAELQKRAKLGQTTREQLP
jgi:hypothetical protein